MHIDSVCCVRLFVNFCSKHGFENEGGKLIFGDDGGGTKIICLGDDGEGSNIICLGDDGGGE